MTPANEQSPAGTPKQTSDAPGSDGTRKFARIREEADKLKGQAADRARTAADRGKEKATTTLEGLAQTVHEAASRMETRSNPQVAEYAHRAADALDSLSASLRRKDIDELVGDARDLVRRNPAVAIGAAIAVGFVLSRFLKATSDVRGRPGYPADANIATTRGNGDGAHFNA